MRTAGCKEKREDRKEKVWGLHDACNWRGRKPKPKLICLSVFRPLSVSDAAVFVCHRCTESHANISTF